MSRLVRLSKSQIVMFGHCAKQWMFRYVEGRKMKPSGAMRLGTAYHETLARNFKQKADTLKDLPLDEQQDFFRDAWEQGLQAEEVVFDEGETPEMLKDQGVGIVKAHHTILAPTIVPASVEAVEERIELNIGAAEDTNFQLVAIIDLTDKNGVIRENKSMGKRPNQPDIDKNIDLSTYSLAKRLQTKVVEPKLAMDIAVKTKSPTALTMETRRSREQLRFHLNRMGHMARAIRAEAFPPNTDWWGCNPKYCGYYSICVGKGMVTVDMGEHLEQQLSDSIELVERQQTLPGIEPDDTA